MLTLQSSKSQIVYLLIVKVELDNYGYNVLTSATEIPFRTIWIIWMQIQNETRTSQAFIKTSLHQSSSNLVIFWKKKKITVGLIGHFINPS